MNDLKLQLTVVQTNEILKHMRKALTQKMCFANIGIAIAFAFGQKASFGQDVKSSSVF